MMQGSASKGVARDNVSASHVHQLSANKCTAVHGGKMKCTYVVLGASQVGVGASFEQETHIVGKALNDSVQQRGRASRVSAVNIT